jgi:hypothetical protein
MDALTFRTPRLLRKLTFSAAQKQPITEVNLEKVGQAQGGLCLPLALGLHSCSREVIHHDHHDHHHHDHHHHHHPEPPPHLVRHPDGPGGGRC